VLLAWTIALILLTQPPPGLRPRSVTTSTMTTDELPAPDAPRISVAILRADDLDHAALTRAIQLRSPALTIVRVGDEAPPAVDGELRVYIEVRRADAVHVDLTLILADGRAYLRRVDVDADAPARPIAGALANLIAGIEDDSVAPDRKDAPVPEALVAPRPPPTKPEPKPAAPRKSQQPAPVQPTDDPPRWQLGPTLRLGATLGLARLDPGFHGLGPGGGLDIRSPRGLLLALDLQHLARPLGAYSSAAPASPSASATPCAAAASNSRWPSSSASNPGACATTTAPSASLLDGGPARAAARPRPAPEPRRQRPHRPQRPHPRRPPPRPVGQRPAREGRPAPARAPPPRWPAVGLGSAELHLGLEIGLWFGVGKPRPR
jgi:hypothetical protein